MQHEVDRRRFLRSGAGLCAFPAAVPWLARRPCRAEQPARSLVLVELAGGHDGLNALIPVEDDAYHKARPTLAQRRGTHPLAQGLALHPRLGPLAELFAEGDLAVVPGVGYPKASRSHFRSMDIWQSARPDVARPHVGWLGLAADELARQGAAVPAISTAGVERPLCLAARKVVVPALASLRDYQIWLDGRAGGTNAVRRATLEGEVRAAATDDRLDRLLKRTAREAYASAAALKQAAEAYRPRVSYPSSAIGRAIELAARALSAPLGTRIVHVRQGGYDTHAGQARVHGGLLADLAAAVRAFGKDMQARSTWDRMLVLVFSEFGRRVHENQSRGTDHGKAGPVFVCGGAVHGGVHGRHPSLVDLDDGDLRFTTDFRSIYREVLESWLGVAAKPILGSDFRATRVLG